MSTTRKEKPSPSVHIVAQRGHIVQQAALACFLTCIDI